jgi:hypothetical protein
LVLGLLANFKVMLFLPVLEKPVDTAQDILDRGLTPVTVDGGQYYINLLNQSTNPVYLQMAKIAVNPKDSDDLMKILKDDVLDAGTHVYLTNYLWPSEQKLGSYHWSKETLEGKSPYVAGWIVNKKWPLNDELSQHILLYNQVCGIFLIISRYCYTT